MAITDPDIVELQNQIEASNFGPSTKMSMANTLAFAAKCNGGPNDPAIRYMLLDSVLFKLSEPERQQAAYTLHQVTCTRAQAIESKLDKLSQPQGSDVVIPLPKMIFGDDKTIRLHGGVAYFGMIAILVASMVFLHFRGEANHKHDIQAVKAAVGLAG